MRNILNYLKENIDDNAWLLKWNGREKFSLHLTGSYEYFLVRLLGEEFLLARPYEVLEIPKMKLQLSIMEKQAQMPVAVLLEEITVYRMKKMLRDKIAFLVVGKQMSSRQMYLPFMALHIRKQKTVKAEDVIYEKFTPATQMIFLFLLYFYKEEFSIEEIAAKLSVSAMTVVRGMNELERVGLVDYKISGQTGRKKLFQKIPSKEYYQMGRPYLQNPVKKTIFVSQIPNHIQIYKSGLTALGEQTMLSEPNQKIYAAGRDAGILLNEFQVSRERAMDEGLPAVQLMKYEPGSLTVNEYVDPISLICGLEQKDERVEIAVGELMEGVEWFGE